MSTLKSLSAALSERVSQVRSRIGSGVARSGEGSEKPSFFARLRDRIPTNGLLALSAAVIWTSIYVIYVR